MPECGGRVVVRVLWWREFCFLRERFSPVVDVEQHDDQYEISVELPGVIGEDVNVEVSDDMLVVSGSKEARRQAPRDGKSRHKTSGKNVPRRTGRRRGVK